MRDMNYVGAVNLVLNGRIITIPVARMRYHGCDHTGPAGGVAESADGSLQIILDARLSGSEATSALEQAAAEVTQRLRARFMN